MLPERLEIELEQVGEENASLAATVNEYQMQAKNSEKNVGEKNQNRIALPQLLKRSKPQVRPIECKIQPLQLRTEMFL